MYNRVMNPLEGKNDELKEGEPKLLECHYSSHIEFFSQNPLEDMMKIGQTLTEGELKPIQAHRLSSSGYFEGNINTGEKKPTTYQVRHSRSIRGLQVIELWLIDNSVLA